MQLDEFKQLLSKPLPGTVKNSEIGIILAQALQRLLKTLSSPYYTLTWANFPEIAPTPLEPLTPSALIEHFDEYIDSQKKTQLEAIRTTNEAGNFLTTQKVVASQWHIYSHFMTDSDSPDNVLLKSLILMIGSTHAARVQTTISARTAILEDTYTREYSINKERHDRSLMGMLEKTFEKGPDIYTYERLITTSLKDLAHVPADKSVSFIMTQSILIPKESEFLLKTFLENFIQDRIKNGVDIDLMRYYRDSELLFRETTIRSDAVRRVAAKHNLIAFLVPAQMMRLSYFQLGHAGRLPTRDAILEVLCNTRFLDTANLLEFIASQVCDKTQAYAFVAFLKRIDGRVKNLWLTAHPQGPVVQILTLIDKQLSSIELHSTARIYYEIIKDLITDILPVYNAAPPASASLHDRMKFFATTHSTDTIYTAIQNMGICYHHHPYFIMQVERVMDEIRHVLVIHNKYSRGEEHAIVAKYFNTAFDYSPIDGVVDEGFLVTSGMHAISLSMSATISEIKTRNSDYVVGISPGTYFEIEMIMSSFFETEWMTADSRRNEFLRLMAESKDETIKSEDPENLMHYYNIDAANTAHMFVSKSAILDVLICSFLNNVSARKPGFSSYEVIDEVRAQLELREESTSERPLMVVIDSVLSGYDALRENLLLSIFSEEIASGKIAVIFAHSLNKYDQLGLDKLACGAIMAYYNPDAFPVLHSKMKQSEFFGLETNPSMQFAVHFLKHSRRHLSSFMYHLIGASAYIHNTLIESSLLVPSASKLISIDPHSTEDLLAEAWSFVTIRFNQKFKDEINGYVHHILKYHLYRNGIFFRDGYGFAQTSMVNIMKSDVSIYLMRVSIGGETLESLRDKFTFLSRVMCDINEITKSPDPEHMTDGEKKLILELLQAYFKKVAFGFPAGDPNENLSVVDSTISGPPSP